MQGKGKKEQTNEEADQLCIQSKHAHTNLEEKERKTFTENWLLNTGEP